MWIGGAKTYLGGLWRRLFGGDDLVEEKFVEQRYKAVITSNVRLHRPKYPYDSGLVSRAVQAAQKGLGVRFEPPALNVVVPVGITRRVKLPPGDPVPEEIVDSIARKMAGYFDECIWDDLRCEVAKELQERSLLEQRRRVIGATIVAR